MRKGDWERQGKKVFFDYGGEGPWASRLFENLNQANFAGLRFLAGRVWGLAFFPPLP